MYELTHLINECLRLSIMLNLWKLGTITPMPKGKISMKPGDWRPVSVLPYPSKIIEKVVNYQLVYHFECKGYLFPNQHGFRKGLSTSTAIFDYVQFLYDSYDKCKSSSSSLTIVGLAFDTIDYVILLRLERGVGQRICLSCACFVIARSIRNIYRHTIHQIKAEYHSYRMVSLVYCNS